MNIRMQKYAGSFAENKDVAAQIRDHILMPKLAKGQTVRLDFQGVTGATQSFVHALISDAIRDYGDDVYERLLFMNCSPILQEVINIVADYMEESDGA